MMMKIDVVSHKQAQLEKLKQDRVAMKFEALANSTATTESVYDAEHTIARSSKLITNYTYERIKEREKQKKREKEQQHLIAIKQLERSNNDFEFE